MSQQPSAPLIPSAASPGLAGSLPLVEELPESLDAWEAAQRLAGERHLLFLDSPVTGTDYSRHSFVAADPFLLVRHDRPDPPDPFSTLAEKLRLFEAETVAGLPPFQGGLAGFFGYEVCHHVERLPR